MHCSIEQGGGYTGLAAIRDKLEADGNHVVLVDNGDSIQGEPIGTMTNGETIVHLMNAVGYDVRFWAIMNLITAWIAFWS